MVPETKTIHQSHGSVSNTTGGRGGPAGVCCAFSSTTVEAPVGPCAGAAEPPEATALGPTAQPRAPRANTATPGAGAAPRRTPVRGPGPRSAVPKPGCPGPLSRGSASLQTAQSAQRPSERPPSGPRRRRPPPRPRVPVRFWPIFISPHFSSRAREDALLSCSKLYPRPGQGSLCLRERGHCGHACHTAAGKPGWGRGALPWPPRAHPTAPHTPPQQVLEKGRGQAAQTGLPGVQA